MSFAFIYNSLYNTLRVILDVPFRFVSFLFWIDAKRRANDGIRRMAMAWFFAIYLHILVPLFGYPRLWRSSLLVSSGLCCVNDKWILRLVGIRRCKWRSISKPSWFGPRHDIQNTIPQHNLKHLIQIVFYSFKLINTTTRKQQWNDTQCSSLGSHQ